MAGYATQCAMPGNPNLIFYWYYKQNKAENASGIHATTIGNVGKQNVDISIFLFVKNQSARDAGGRHAIAVRAILQTKMLLWPRRA